ncbi:MAG TPA: ATP-binding protein, partial [Desulfomicrobiaceae bacterium]|nr:ATP-binding protein [Desulfomicrobiaceae bacterium]
RKTESELKRSRARLQDAQRLASMGNWEYKEEEPFHISESLFDMFHCPEEERKAGFRALWKRVHPEDRKELRSTFTPAVTTSRFFDHEFRYLPDPGVVRYAHAIGVTRPAGNDGRFHSYGTLQDVTEFRWLAEQALQAKERAERASRSKTAFLARMSHEVRTPLNAIMGMLFMLEESGLNGDQAGFVRGAHQAADGLLGVLNQVLDLAGIESGNVSLDRERFSIGELLQAVSDGFAGQARSKGIRLTHDLDHELPVHIVTDKGRLRQILFNLVANAIKFTDTGAVSIQASRAGAGRAPGTLRMLLSVSDTGSGISWEDQDQVFNSFSRGTSSVARGVPGTGLGLAIVRELADLFGGHLSLESAPGEGTTVHFCCSVQEGEEAVAPAGTERSSGPGEPEQEMAELRVLVAEDHPLNQVYAIMLLEKMGHRAEGVGTGREVLESLAEKGWDLILMDVEMPDMDGLEACRRIRAGTVHGCPPDIPIVALTGHTMAEDVFRFHEAGMSAHLPKPLCGDGLQQVIRSLINGA